MTMIYGKCAFYNCHVASCGLGCYVLPTTLAHALFCTFSLAQLAVKSVVEHIAFRLFTIMLIFIEFCLVVMDLWINTDGHLGNLSLASQIIMGYFVLELCARLFYKG